MNNKNVENTIIEIISKNAIEIEGGIKLENRLVDIGINSLSYVKSIVQLENEFGFEFKDEDLDFRKIESIQDIYNKVIEYLNK